MGAHRTQVGTGLQVNRAIGVFMILAENEAGDPTMMAKGPNGPLAEGYIDGTATTVSEEGVVAITMPSLGMVPLMWLDVPGSPYHYRAGDRMRNKALDMAREMGRRFELVKFGEQGREHVEWIG